MTSGVLNLDKKLIAGNYIVTATDENGIIQLGTQVEPGDILIALSGSGNSLNIIKALEMAKNMGLATFAILGYSGGRCMALADSVIHVAVNDMQIAEDTQLIVGHMLMQWLRENPANMDSAKL
ncbi:MAG: SIS domain-containing protein [Chlorobiaceae bacterium]